MKGGGSSIIDLVSGLVLHIFSAVADLLDTMSDFIGDNDLSILYHMVFILSYGLCFYYMQFKNTEMSSVSLLLVLHLVFLYMLLSVRVRLPPLFEAIYGKKAWNYGTFSIYFVLIGWVFLLFAIGFLAYVYYNLYQQFIPNRMEISFGDMEFQKNELLKTLFYAVVFMWGFYILEYLKTNDVILINVLLICVLVYLLFLILYTFITFPYALNYSGNPQFDTFVAIIYRFLVSAIYPLAFILGLGILSVLLLFLIQRINDARIDFDLFFTRNQLANNMILLVGMVFIGFSMYTYYQSSGIAAYTRSITIPNILQVNQERQGGRQESFTGQNINVNLFGEMVSVNETETVSRLGDNTYYEFKYDGMDCSLNVSQRYPVVDGINLVNVMNGTDVNPVDKIKFVSTYCQAPPTTPPFSVKLMDMYRNGVTGPIPDLKSLNQQAIAEQSTPKPATGITIPVITTEQANQATFSIIQYIKELSGIKTP